MTAIVEDDGEELEDMDVIYMDRVHAAIKRAITGCGEFQRSECVYVLLTIIGIMTAGLKETQTPEDAEAFGLYLGKELGRRITSIRTAMDVEEARHHVKH